MLSRRAALGFISMLPVLGCSPKRTEIGRVTNPTRSLDAVLVLRETGATVATPTEIFLTSVGGRPTGDPIFRADKVEGLRAEWMAADVLRISAQAARTFVEQAEFPIHVGGRKQLIHIQYQIALRPE